MKRIKLPNKDENTVDRNDNPEEANTNWKTKALRIRSKNLKSEMPLETTQNQRKSARTKQSLSKILPEESREKTSQLMPKLKLKNLTNFKKGSSKELTPDLSPTKKKLRATVNIEMMKEELKQLEDPPTTQREIELSSARLRYEFFDSPCETLAQNLLGKILVRQLENGTILKGRIVETESYLGAIDKASQTYQNRITPRNIPMYMPPGTIYVYLTYGMYHCFNISSQEPGACVFIRAVEPLLGLNYMELLRNTRLKRGKKEKEMTKRSKLLKPHQLCNGPFKLCTALDIDGDTFNERNISRCNDLWIETDTKLKTITAVAAPRIGIEPVKDEWPVKLLRFYVLGNSCVSERNVQCDGCAVLVRSIEPLEGMDRMTNLRNLKPKSKEPRTLVKYFKPHELCNGPSKLCMAFDIEKPHSKYSMCTWKYLWLEDDVAEQEIKIVQCARIGIDSAGPEWASKPLRYYVYGNKSVSKRDKKAETELLQSD